METGQVSWEQIKYFFKGFAPHLPDYLHLGAQHDMAEMASWWLDVIHREASVSTSAGVPPSLPKKFQEWMNGGYLQNANNSTSLSQKALKTWHQFHLKDSGRQWEWTMQTEGLLVYQIQCLNCGKCFHNFEPFHCIPLEPSESLETSFRRYFETEKATDWSCDMCHKKIPAERLVRFWKAPETLVIQWKRFDGHQKIKTPLSFPLEFCLLENTELCRSASTTTPTCYDLVAVGNHYGSLYGGHYTATCRSRWMPDEWVEIDDDGISRMNPTQKWWENNPNAYMLFYVRRNAAN
jgi:ubiquitin C-terminal hydrolase